MLSFKVFLKESPDTNTPAANVNELALAYFLAGGNPNKLDWNKTKIKPSPEKEFNSFKSKIDDQLYTAKFDQGGEMAEYFIDWIHSHKPQYKGDIIEVHWTGRSPSALTDIMRSAGVIDSKTKIDSRQNPTDILVRFRHGPNGGYFGISAKSTMTASAKVGFKNPGLGTIDKSLGIDLTSIQDAAFIDFTKKNKWASGQSKDKIKAHLKANKTDEEIARTAGNVVLKKVRDGLVAELNSRPIKFIKKYLAEYWLDVGTDNLSARIPEYVKLTAKGMKSPYNISIEDPSSNDTIAAIMDAETIEFVATGENTIAVMVDNKKIFTIRAKYTSTAMATSIKFSAQ